LYWNSSEYYQVKSNWLKRKKNLTFSIFYFAHYKHQRTFYRLMLMLAVVDTLFLIFSSLTFCLPHLNQHYAEHYWMILVPYTLPLAQTCLTASVYMTISLTAERFFSVVHPLYQLQNRWLRSSLLLTAPGIVFSIIFTLPNYFQLCTVTRDSTVLSDDDLQKEFPNLSVSTLLNLTQNHVAQFPENNLTVQRVNETYFLIPAGRSSYNITISEDFTLNLMEKPYFDIQFANFRSNPIYIKVYVLWLNLIFNLIIPLLILGCLNKQIYKKLNQIPERCPSISSNINNSVKLHYMTLRRTRDSKLRKRERRLARISILIVIIFIICHSVKNIPNIVEIFGEDPRKVPVISQILLIGHLLLSVNSSVNFLVYSFGNSRKVFRYLFSIFRKTVTSDTAWLPSPCPDGAVSTSMSVSVITHVEILSRCSNQSFRQQRSLELQNN